MNYGFDPLLQGRDYTVPEIEKEQEAIQQKIERLKQDVSTE